VGKNKEKGERLFYWLFPPAQLIYIYTHTHLTGRKAAVRHIGAVCMCLCDKGGKKQE
jgi:hypothetical protein